MLYKICVQFDVVDEKTELDTDVSNEERVYLTRNTLVSLLIVFPTILTTYKNTY